MTSNCEIEAIVSFDERGQLVIPKDLRKKFNLKAGDKFALISCLSPSNCCSSEEDKGACSSDPEGDSSLCCFTLINTNQLKGILGQALSPVMSKLFT